MVCHTLSRCVMPSTGADAASDMEVQALFDDIEYQKGGSVLRMLWNYMSSSHYDSARLPANVQPGHDVFVRPSRPSMTCPATAMPAHAFLPMCSQQMHWLMNAGSASSVLQAQEACARCNLHTV